MPIDPIFDRLDTDEPDAPENCVVCTVPLDPDGTGTIDGFNGDGCTCSEACHARHLRAQAEHRASEEAADAALIREWAMEREGFAP